MKNKLLKMRRWIAKKLHSAWIWATTVPLGAIVIWMIQNGKLPGALPALKRAIHNVYGFLTAPLAIPRLWYWLSTLSILAWAILICYSFYHSRRGMSYRSYTKDFFEGIIWRWRWNPEDGQKESQPNKIVAHCPNCDLELSEEGGGVYLSAGPAPSHILRCNTCRRTFPFVGASHIKKLIMRNIRDNSWKGRLDVSPSEEFLDRSRPKK